MKQPMKYRNYYKCTLAEGVCHGFQLSKNLQLQFGERIAPCAYITQMFDTKDEDMTYHRLLVDCRLADVKLETIVAVTNDPDATDENGTPLKKLLANPQAAPAKKEAALRALPHVRTVNTTDMLLHDLKGRYVWVFVAVYPSGLEAQCTIEGLRLEFPKYSFSEYFPEIYQENDFFERYLAVLQTIFLDEEKKVDEVPAMLDYESTPEAYVQELANWLGIDNKNNVFTPEQLRHIIRNIDLYQGGKGTRETLKKMIELVTGIKPRIIEAFQWDGEDMPAYRRQTYKKFVRRNKKSFLRYAGNDAQKRRAQLVRGKAGAAHRSLQYGRHSV